MGIVRLDSAKLKFYHFLKDNYPWDWGTYDKFVWKHINDPFITTSDFYILEDNGKIESLCVARKYPYEFYGSSYDILSMMDFVTDVQNRQNGKLSTILQYIYNNVFFDYSIGFSSKQLHDTVHKKTACVQVYYTYLLAPVNVPLASFPCNDAEVVPYLNANKNSFQIMRTSKYLNYIKNNPSYQKVLFIKNNDLVIGVAFEKNKEGSIRVIEISNYSFDSCIKAYKMASIFGRPIKIDLPQKIEYGNFLRETCFDVFAPNFNYSIFQKGELIWVPVSDRK